MQDHVWRIVEECWANDSAQRPKANDLVQRFNEAIELPSKSSIQTYFEDLRKVPFTLLAASLSHVFIGGHSSWYQVRQSN